MLLSQETRYFSIFALAHLLLWTLIPTLVSPNPPLDVIEGYAWGREWVIGTHKHPPMQAWILELFANLTHRARFAHFLASQLAVILAFWAIWQTCRRIMDVRAALASVLLLEGIAYYQFTTPEFNPNVLLLPAWALSAWAFYCAMRENRLYHWLLLGIFAAAGLYSKYTMALMLASLALLFMITQEGRARLKEKGPYLALVTAFLLFLPHLAWLYQHDFIALTYAESRFADESVSFLHAHILQPLWFIIESLAILIPTLLLLLLLKPKFAPRLRDFDRTFLDVVTFGPFALIVLIEIIYPPSLRNMWCSACWNFLGAWLVFHFKPVVEETAFKRLFHIVLSLILLTSSGYAASHIISSHLGKPHRAAFNGQLLSAQIEEGWSKATGSDLRYVVGDIWLAGNIGYHAKARPHVWVDGDLDTSQWIDPQDFKKQGGVMIWCTANCSPRRLTPVPEPAYIRERFPEAIHQSPILLPWANSAKLPPMNIGWAIAMPQDGK